MWCRSRLEPARFCTTRPSAASVLIGWLAVCCLSPEQAGDTAATFSPEYRTVNSGCERVEFNSSPTALRWRIRCTGQLDMDVAGDFAFDTPKHYSATIVSKGAMAGREVVNTTVSIEGEHIGDCR